MTFVEILIVLALAAALSIAAITSLANDVDYTRYQATVAQLNNIKEAVVGSPDLRTASGRVSFGYVGDVGNFPTTAAGLGGLLTNPFSVSGTNTNGVVLGWYGPYMKQIYATNNLLLDGWKNPYQVSIDNVGGSMTVTSYGADGVAGGTGVNADITMTLSLGDYLGRIDGTILNGLTPYDYTATVTIQYGDGAGNISTSSYNVLPESNGYFTFSNIPFGYRALYVYVPNITDPIRMYGPYLIKVDKRQSQISTEATINIGDQAPRNNLALSIFPSECFDDGTQVANNNSSLNIVNNSTGFISFSNATLGSNRNLWVELRNNPAQSIDQIAVGSQTFTCSMAQGSFTFYPCTTGQWMVLNPTTGWTTSSTGVNVHFVTGTTLNVTNAHMFLNADYNPERSCL